MSPFRSLTLVFICTSLAHSFSLAQSCDLTSLPSIPQLLLIGDQHGLSTRPEGSDISLRVRERLFQLSATRQIPLASEVAPFAAPYTPSRQAEVETAVGQPGPYHGFESERALSIIWSYYYQYVQLQKQNEQNSRRVLVQLLQDSKHFPFSRGLLSRFRRTSIVSFLEAVSQSSYSSEEIQQLMTALNWREVQRILNGHHSLIIQTINEEHPDLLSDLSIDELPYFFEFEDRFAVGYQNWRGYRPSEVPFDSVPEAGSPLQKLLEPYRETHFARQIIELICQRYASNEWMILIVGEAHVPALLRKLSNADTRFQITHIFSGHDEGEREIDRLLTEISPTN